MSMIDNDRIRTIHREYLSLIENHYAEERFRFEKSGVTLDKFIATEIFRSSSDLSIVKGRGTLSSEEYKAVAFQEDVRAFWAMHWISLEAAIGRDTGLSVCVWADMDIENLVRRYAVYFDSIFIPDPIAKYVQHIPGRPSPALYSKSYFVWTLIILSLNELLLADTDPLPIVLYPQRFSIGDSHGDERGRVQDLQQTTDLLTYHYMSEILGVEGTELKPMSLFERAMSTDLELLGRRIETSDLSRFLGTMLENLDMFPVLMVGGFEGLLTRIKVGKVTRRDLQRIFTAVQSSFYMLEAREENARMFHSDNAVGKMLWTATKEKNVFLAKRLNTQLESSEPRVVAASFENRFQWLDNLTNEELIRVRSVKHLRELRRLFEVDRRVLKSAPTEDFANVSREYEKAVVSRLEAFSAQLVAAGEELARKRKQAIASFIVSAGLGAASLALPTLAILSILSFAYGTIVGGSSVWDLISNYRKDPGKETEAIEPAITLLLEAHEHTRDESFSLRT